MTLWYETIGLLQYVLYDYTAPTGFRTIDSEAVYGSNYQIQR